MGTNATIAHHQKDGGVRSIYVHFDGYMDHTGAILRKKYIDDETVVSLIDLGDISVLGDDIDETIAYGRDRGETDTQAAEFKSLRDFLRSDMEMYAYLFDGVQWKMVRDGELVDFDTFKNLEESE